ncbi:hypothetical protein [Parapedobacter sp.]
MGKIIGCLFAILAGHALAWAQSITADTRAAIEKIEQLQLDNQSEKALEVLHEAIGRNTGNADDLAYLYAHQSGIYVSCDSLLLGKRLLDSSMAYAVSDPAKALAYRASAHLNNHLNKPDQVVKDALTGLTYLEGHEDQPVTAYYLNYLLYGAHSKWDDQEKMGQYIRKCAYFAEKADRPDLVANALNGMYSMHSAAYKRSKKPASLDSMFHYLRRSFLIQREHPGKVGGNTLTITCINLANYFLVYADNPIDERKEQAEVYLAIAEEELNRGRAAEDMWVNVLGIKSGFAMEEDDIPQAEAYLLQAVSRIHQHNRAYPKEEYSLFKALADIAVKKRDVQAALGYQQAAEAKLKQIFNQEQIFNAQRLEIQYETDKKDGQLKLLAETAALRKRQNYLYGGLALALLIGLVFMFTSYRFKLRYSRERERKLAWEKEEAQRYAAMQLKMEKEEQARLKAEQELLELQRQQLQKEALANSVIIERKNDTLNQIRDKLKEGDAHLIRKLLKKETLLHTDFEKIKVQLQELHPGFFKQLNNQAVQKLTLLDQKYCTYIYLKMDTKQIAQTLHIETQSVRMFKYRLKQKLGLPKEMDLEQFIQQIGD